MLGDSRRLPQEHRPYASAHLGSVRSVMEDIKLADNLSWNDFQRAPPVRGRTKTEMSRLWEEYREGGCRAAKLKGSLGKLEPKPCPACRRIEAGKPANRAHTCGKARAPRAAPTPAYKPPPAYKPSCGRGA